MIYDKEITTINIDVDGVLYDFVGAMAKIDGYVYQGRWIEYVNNLGMTHIEYISQKFDEYIDKGLFEVGEQCLGAYELLTHICTLKHKYDIKVNILGALPYNHTAAEKVKQHKLHWLNKEYIYPDTMVFDDIIFVNGSKGKNDYAAEDAILIDDYFKNQNRYKELNAPFILYRSPEQTIQELSQYKFKSRHGE